MPVAWTHRANQRAWSFYEGEWSHRIRSLMDNAISECQIQRYGWKCHCKVNFTMFQLFPIYNPHSHLCPFACPAFCHPATPHYPQLASTFLLPWLTRHAQGLMVLWPPLEGPSVALTGCISATVKEVSWCQQGAARVAVAMGCRSVKRTVMEGR